MRYFRNFPFVLAAVFLSACGQGAPSVKPLTGLVDATEIDVASKIPGRVTELAVREGDAVEKGQKLAVIESDEITAKMQQVQAAMGAADAKLRMARSGARQEEVEAARRQVEAAKHQVQIAQKTYERVEKLHQANALADAKLDEAKFQYDIARDQLAVTEAKLSVVRKGARPEEIEALTALVDQAKGTLAEVTVYEKEMVQTSPIAGEVSKIVVHRGELAATGYPIVTLVDLSDMWVTFTLREDALRTVRKGTKIQVHVPALDREAQLEVYHIASMGDFATWRATSERDAFDLKSFEVRARPTEPIEGLRPGMTIRWTLE
jgi:HlyD family secretion protein